MQKLSHFQNSRAFSPEHSAGGTGSNSPVSSLRKEPEKSRKIDQRVRMTRKLFRQALTELLQEKNLQSITVKELCEAAGVNRGTFYAHYADLYDLMEQIEDEIYEELQAALRILDESKSRPEGPTPFSLYAALMGFIRKNSDMCAFLLSEHGDRTFLGRLFEAGREACIQAYKEGFPSASREDLELFYDFVSSGCVGILRRWIGNGMVPSETSIAQSLEAMITGAQAFLR